MNSIIKKIEESFKDFKIQNIKKNIGTVLSVSDGVAKIDGLSNVMYNEIIKFDNDMLGIALNLEEYEIGCVILGDQNLIKAGNRAFSTGELLKIPVGKKMLGRVIDVLGFPLDNKGKISTNILYPIERQAPNIIWRESVSEPLQTGIMAIDSMIPIGKGQRELIIGDRSTGKTSIAIDTIINQSYLNKQAEKNNIKNFKPVYSIYIAIGQKNSDIANIIKILEDEDALQYTVIIASNASDNVAKQYLAPYSGTAIGEWFMYNGMDALVIYDDLSKHAIAYRQISLILKRPSGREAYPGDIFYLHSRLLERSGRLSKKYGGGSLTALPIVETQSGDISSYIPTNIISITDGQIFLDKELFNKDIRPSISLGLSVSRVGSKAQLSLYKKLSSGIKLEAAQYRELAAFSQFGSELDVETKRKLHKGEQIIEILKQKELSPRKLEIQILILWGLQNNLFQDIKNNELQNFIEILSDNLNCNQDFLMKINDATYCCTINNDLKNEIILFFNKCNKIFMNNI